MAITKWTSIVNGQDGDAVSQKFDDVFEAIDDWQEAVQPEINYVDTLTTQQQVVNKDGIQIGTILAEGIYKVDTNLPNGETSGKLTIRLYGSTQYEHELLSYTTGKLYRRYYTIATTSFSEWVFIGVVSGNSLLLNPVDDDTYAEGKITYNSVTKTFDFMGPYAGVKLRAGHETHMHVVNNTGALLEKGMAVRHDGVAGGKVQVQKAIATTFDNARILGVVTADIAVGAEGAITTFGEITPLDTNTLPAGVPLYLSDTVAGTYTATPPPIASRVGGALTSDALTGSLFVYPVNNLNLPNVFGGMQGQVTPLYPLTTTAVDIVNYFSEEALVITNNLATGEISLPNAGNYRMHFTASVSFVTSTSTRSVTIELYDVTDPAIVYPYTKNIPRDATLDALSFSWPLKITAANVYKMRVKSSVAMNLTFDNISFDIQSISIR